MLIASRDSAAAQLAVRRRLDEKYPGMQIQFYDFQQGILDQLVGDRMMARLSGFFGVLAALLVVVGLHGLLSYFVAQRRGEIGIRMALGATRGRIVVQMVRNACVMLAVGLVAGTVLALLAGREAGTFLPQAMGPGDPRWRRRAHGGGHRSGQPGSVNARAKRHPIEALRAE